MSQLEFSFSAPEATPELRRFRTRLTSTIVTPREAALYLGTDRAHVYYLINFGYIEATKIRWLWRIRSKSLEAYDQRRCA